MTPWIIGAVIVAALIALFWWLLIETEGVYLGRRVVIWLYDLYANRYDRIKGFDPIYDHMYLSQPIMDDIAPHKSPFVLDIATGTGRLPIAMLKYAHFQGRIVGVDLSRPMLARAAEKIQSDRVSLICTPAESLPFPDNTFDVVTCLEALEFMADAETVLREAVRVLRPGGLLLLTNRINTRWMPGKTLSSEQIEALLHKIGVEEVLVEFWQVDYDRVWGHKDGDSAPRGARPLGEILRCPTCHQLLVEEKNSWQCPAGHTRAQVGADGVIDLANAPEKP